MAACKRAIFLYLVSLTSKYKYILLKEDPIPSTLRWTLSAMLRLVIAGSSNRIFKTFQSVSLRVRPRTSSRRVRSNSNEGVSRIKVFPLFWCKSSIWFMSSSRRTL